MTSRSLHAMRRFGFGRRGNEPLPDDEKAWLRAQLDAADPLLARPGPSTANAILVGRNEAAAAKNGTVPPTYIGKLFRDEMTALLRTAVATDLPLRERLVWFWSNHFSVSGRAGALTLALIGAYIQEAIRPHVTGRLQDMVKAVMRHPAMLFYLDEDSSVGPGSRFGREHHLGLNENLARESLELHTLGVDAGYTQADVTAFAALLSGRTVNQDGESPDFAFRIELHEPAPKPFIGQVFPPGFAGSEAAVEWIANHPATRHHVATQLVRHFVADDPPADYVAKVVDCLNATGGDLKQAMLAIIDMPQAWSELTKFQAPAEYVIAVQRALDLPPEPDWRLYDAVSDLGQPVMGALLPNGWPDTEADWISGEALLKRADWAVTQGQRPGVPGADAIAAAALGDMCSQSTLDTVRRCPNPAEAIAMVFASPEFVRR